MRIFQINTINLLTRQQINKYVNRFSPSHITKLSKVKNKENFERNKRRAKIIYKGTLIRLPVNFWVETLQTRRKWDDICKVLKEPFCLVSSGEPDECVQIHPGANEEEAVWYLALSSEGLLLAVLAALALHRDPDPTWPDKACQLGYKAKQGYIIFRICVPPWWPKLPSS